MRKLLLSLFLLASTTASAAWLSPNPNYPGPTFPPAQEPGVPRETLDKYDHNLNLLVGRIVFVYKDGQADILDVPKAIPLDQHPGFIEGTLQHRGVLSKAFCYYVPNQNVNGVYYCKTAIESQFIQFYQQSQGTYTVDNVKEAVGGILPVGYSTANSGTYDYATGEAHLPFVTTESGLQVIDVNLKYLGNNILSLESVAEYH